MSVCMCGNPIDTIGAMCSRCGALQTLGLEMNASWAEIEGAYLTMVKVWHPDRFQTDPKMRLAAEEKLKEINAAHDYLLSAPSYTKPPKVVARDSEPLKDREEPSAAIFDSTESSDDEEPEDVRRVMMRLRKRSIPKILIKLMVAAGAFAVVGLLWFSFDFFLSENAKTAAPWEEFKAEVSRDIHANGLRLWANVTENVKVSKHENEPAAVEHAPQERAPTAENPVARGEEPAVIHSTRAGKVLNGAKPYVTSGLTPMEVLSILGSPTSSSGEKMFYKGSEIYFRNGHVAGWKIDPKSAPIRVKLWPDAAPVPGVTTFAVGSSKSDVIALQGTPTLFSDNQFGYGGSIIFFQNNRVAGWKEDPSSVRLRVMAH